MHISTIEWPAVSAIVALLAVTIALFFNMRNLATTRLSNSAKMVLDLVGSFDSEDMRKQRSRFAKRLLDDSSGLEIQKDMPVLQFFEEVAYMTKRKVLDDGMVWNSFSWIFLRYYHAVTHPIDLIAKARRDSHSITLYQEIQWLQVRLIAIECKEEGAEKLTSPSDDEVAQFLKDEANLV